MLGYRSLEKIESRILHTTPIRPIKEYAMIMFADLFKVSSRFGSLLTREPHTRYLQNQSSCRPRPIPPEAINSTDSTEGIDEAVGAAVVPESSAVAHCAVVVVGAVGAGPRVVVTVIGREHHVVVVG